MNQNDLQQIDQLLQKRLKGFATKKDLAGFAMKSDLQQFATKSDLMKMKKDLEEHVDSVFGDFLKPLIREKQIKEKFTSLTNE
ncbi:MAG: hypothetical protein HY430_03520 [Candidatus Levybacteria bacterium]|nr:hypothetical protein [Candidatus Levybacteria bacterium]